MKKVFLSLAAVAVLTVVSCKEKTAEVAPEAAVEETTMPTDTVKVEATEVASPAVEAPATEEPAKKM